MVSIQLDMIQTAGIGALALLAGMTLTRRVDFLQKFCVPSPVSGGIIFSLLTLALYGWGDVEVSFDGTLKDVFMLAFFTSVGFQSDLKVIKQGGRLLIIMLVLLVAIISLQNLMPMGITRLMGVDPLIGMAAATFGLIAGSMIGGPLAERITRKKLTHEQMQPQDEEIDPAMAAIARNIIPDKHLDMDRIISVGNICLSLFLGMAMISLKLWELQSLALPLIVILGAQVVMMALFAYFVAFPLLGRDYDAALLCAGMCGFGLGATPNAMANMSAVCYKYRYTVKPFLIVPIIGAMFADLINTGIITLFLNIFV